MNRFVPRVLALVLCVVFAPELGAAEKSATTGPHGGVIAQGEGQRLEVKYDPSAGVKVFVLERTRDFPGALGISLRDEHGNETLLELKTMDPAGHPILYTGSPAGGAQSFVGFELKIPFGRKPAVVLRGNLGERLPPSR